MAQPTVPPTIAQQTFTIIGGIAAGAGGLVLATRLTQFDRVNSRSLALAGLISAIATFGSVFIITGE